MWLFGSASAQVLDENFGSKGAVSLKIASDREHINTMVQQPDGKIVAAGYSGKFGEEELVIVRLNSNGSLDTDFADKGIKVLTPTKFRNIPTSLYLKKDGTILVVGYCGEYGSQKALLVLLNSDGSLVEDFGNSGVVISDPTKEEVTITSSVLLEDGKLLVAGFTGASFSEHFLVARYNEDGSLDASFGTKGTTSFVHGQGRSQCQDMLIDHKERIVMGGYTVVDGDYIFMLARLKPDGELDDDFGTNGIATSNLGSSNDELFTLDLSPEGKIMAGGVVQTNTEVLFGVARYNEDGSLDKSFQNKGYVLTDMGNGYAFLNDLKVLSDGGIIAVGQIGVTNPRLIVASYHADGSINKDFNSTGKLQLDDQFKESSAGEILVQTNGKVLLGGTINNQMGLLRFGSGILSEETVEMTKITSVFPNPASEHVTILINEETVSGVDLYNVMGVIEADVAWIHSPQRIELDLKETRPGIYYVKILLDNGQVVTKQLLLRRD